MVEYEVGELWAILKGESEADPDTALDLARALTGMSDQEQIFIIAISQGFPTSQAMILSNLRGDQTRIKRQIIRKLVRLMNGEESNG